jgi:Xaa-Pro aminopeptidase
VQEKQLYMFSTNTYTTRRQQLKTAVGNGLILLPANEESSMNYTDNLYHFRQDSCFLYYFGIDRPSIAAVIDIDNNIEYLFGNELTMDEIIWTGPLESLGSLAAKVGVSTVKPYSELAGILKNAQSSGRTVHFLPPYRADAALKISEWLSLPLASLKSEASVPLIKAIVQQRSIKTNEELAEMEKAVNTTAAMQLAVMNGAREGLTEAELAGKLVGIAVSAGGHLAFPSILTVNGQVLHNHYSHTVLQKGQMVLCDCGAETALHYAGDMTRTLPVDKSFSTRQKEIYQVVYNAHQAAVAALRPGIRFKEVHLIACTQLVKGLSAIGLMKGDAEAAVAAGAHTMFFQCGLGHMIGLDVHDMENLGEQYVGYTDALKKSTEFGLKSLRLGRELEAGFTLTIEPGVYIIPELIDSWAAVNKHADFINYDKLQTYRDFGGIRIEDDYVITPEGSRLLGNPLPRTVQEVEALR